MFQTNSQNQKELYVYFSEVPVFDEYW